MKYTLNIKTKESIEKTIGLSFEKIFQWILYRNEKTHRKENW